MQPVRHLAGFALVIILASASTLHGWGLTEKPFGFRLQITDDPAAHPILAMNPAGDDFTREPPFNYKVLGGLV